VIEIIGTVIVEVIGWLVADRDPWGIVSLIFALVGFGLALVCAFAGLWLGAALFTALGLFGTVGVVVKARKRNR
jgi:uncharacterized membrane protein (DUF485 family)